MHRKSIVTLVIFILIFMAGCSKGEDSTDINDYNISYLEVLENGYLVDNEVHISVIEADAINVILNIREYGQEEIEKTIEGEKNGSEWEFVYINSNLFTKEIWLTYIYEDGERESEKSIITNRIQSLENAFENIIPIKSDANIKLIKQNIDLSILGWMGRNKILARDNEDLFIFDIYKNEKEVLIEDIYNVYPSPSLKYLVYQANEGIYYGDSTAKNSKKILDIQGRTFFKDLAWSSMENNIFLHLVEDDTNMFYLIDLNHNNINDFSIEGYTIEELIYMDNGYLYALGHTSNEDIETDAPNSLLRIHISTGAIKNLTPNLQPMDEIKILSQVNAKEFLVRITTTTIAEDDVSRINNIYLLNTQNPSLKILKKDLGSPFVYSLSPDKKHYIYLKKLDSESGQGENMILLGDNKKREVEILKTIHFHPTLFYWSKDGDQLLFYLNNTKEAYLIEFI